MSRAIRYDVPRSTGVENFLARCRHMTEFKWTPTQQVYLAKDKDGYPYYAPCRNGKAPEVAEEIRGIPYSSARIANKFVGIDISFDTFLTAVQNPASVLYQRDNSDFNAPEYNCAIDNTFFYYGTVCSAFADYVYDMPVHRCTYEWGLSQDFYELTDGTANCLQLGDCMVVNRADGTVGGHIRVVSGIGRDEQGKVRMIEVSEGVTATATARWYTAEEFARTLLTGSGSDRIFRYRWLDSVGPVAPMVSFADGQVMLNYGDYSNYMVGDMVEINLNTEHEMLVIQSDEITLEIPVADIGTKTIQGNTYKMYCTDSLAPGSYMAYTKTGLHKSGPVHFKVCKLPQVKLTRPDGTEFESIALKVVEPEGAPLTRDSKCLYNEDGSLKTRPFFVGLSDGTRLLRARVGVREVNGELILRPGATLKDKDGNPVITVKVGEDVTLYALRAKENETVRVTFGGGEQCEPDYISWTEERVVCHNQNLFTPNELHQGYADCIVRQFLDNRFANFLMYCANDFGKVATQPVTFLLD